MSAAASPIDLLGALPQPPSAPRILRPRFHFTPRWYQQPIFAAMAPRDDQLAKRHGCLVWPRRRGKDLTGLTLTVIKALRRVGAYYYFFPTYRLAKRVIWDGMDQDGIPYRAYIPGEVVENENETEMQVELSNGSLIYFLGADKIDLTARGTNVVGAVYSEYRDMSPTVRRTIAPILGNNRGWELIISTPRGNNHLYKLVQKITTDPVLREAWYYSFHTIDTCAVSPEDLAEMYAHLDQLRREGTPEEWIQQEYYCSFAGFQEGSFFADDLAMLHRDSRVCDLPTSRAHLVHTASDLGTGLSFATWYWQEIDEWIHVIDYSELLSGGIPQFKEKLAEKRYLYGDHFVPFDIGATEIGTGITRLETAQDLNIDFLALPKVSAIGDRINAGRTLLSRVKIDRRRCAEGLERLTNYRRKFDEDAETYIEKEVHDRNSHGGSAFTYMGMAVSDIGDRLRQNKTAEMDFDEYDYDTRHTRVAEDGYRATGDLYASYYA